MNKKLCLVLACLVVFVGAMIAVELVRADSETFAVHRKCSSPSNISDCAGYCDGKVECKKCCNRGGFPGKQIDICMSRCDRVYSVTIGTDPGSAVSEGDEPLEL